jgi:hypothetical protein
VAFFSELKPCVPVTPAQAGVHVRKNWIPAYAGMTCVR